MDVNDDAAAYDGYGGADEEEYEVEDVTDDTPMHITGRLFLGSIDAARNDEALSRARIAFTLALLGATDHGDRIPAAPSSGTNTHSSEQRLVSAATLTDDVTRTEIAIEDALDEALFPRLPAILATLNGILEQAERADKNVLVHCVAGRSRSPSVVTAWLIAQSPASKYTSAAQAIEEITYDCLIRPWIAINAHFQSELELFLKAATCTELQQREVQALVHRNDSLPRVDFGESLVTDIVAGRKTITMRLESDREDDASSDLKDVFQHSTVVATTASVHLQASKTTPAAANVLTPKRQPFAVLRVQLVKTKCLSELDAHDLQKSGFASIPEVLKVLRQFYPHVSEATPLLMLHFQCIGQVNYDLQLNQT